jgi:DNA polymerase elongation subunit (family B)
LFGEQTANRLSPFGIVRRRTVEVFGKEKPAVNFIGVVDFDYLQLYQQYTYHAIANYRLDTVADYHLHCGKLHHNGSFNDFYTNHWDKFVAYNIRDTLLVVEIDKATDLVSVGCSVAFMCGSSINDTFGTIKKLDALTMQYANKRNVIIPPTQYQESETFPGGYVAEPVVGRSFAVVSVDAASLYPSMIRELNISPETQVQMEKLPEPIQKLMQTISVDGIVNETVDFSCLKGTPYVVTAAGVCYDQTQQGLVPWIMDDLYNERKAAKKRSLAHKQNYLAAKAELEKRGIAV